MKSEAFESFNIEQATKLLASIVFLNNSVQNKLAYTHYGSYKSERKRSFVNGFVSMWFFNGTTLGVFFNEKL